MIAGHPATVTRHALSGEAIGAPVALPDADAARVLPVRFGPPAALWLGAETVWLGLDRNQLELSPLPATGAIDLAVPLTAPAAVLAQGGTLRLTDLGGERWATPALEGSRLIAGSAIFEARAIALMIQGYAQALVVVSARDGGLQHRIPLSDVTAVRFAARRGYALLRSGEHRLAVVDLRFGKIIKEVEEARVIADIAIDDAAQHIALKLIEEDGQPSTVYVPFRELPTGNETNWVVNTTEARRHEPEDPDAARLAAARAAIHSRVAPEAPETPELELPPMPTPTGPLMALTPRLSGPGLSRDEALRLLDRYLQLVGCWCERAIALGWDNGTIAYPNETARPFEKEVAGILGRGAGSAAGTVKEADLHAGAAAAAVRAAEMALGERLSPLRTLATEFSLSRLGCEILIAIAAPTLWGELARLYGILANDPDRPLVDELLICQIIGRHRVSPHDVARELDRDQPLIKYGLVRPGEGKTRPFLSLTVDPLVLRHLRGQAMEADTGEVTSIRRADRTLAQLVLPADLMARVVADLARAPKDGFVRVVVRGRLGSGRRTLLAALAEAANRPLGLIDASLLARDPRQRVDALRAALRRVVLRGWLPCVDGLDDISQDDQVTRDQMRELFRSHPGPVALRLPWDATPPLDAGYLLVDLPVLTDSQRAQAWQAAIGAHGLQVRDVEALSSRYRVGPGIIERTASAVAAQLERHANGHGRAPRDVSNDLETTLRQHMEVRLGNTATRVTRLGTWGSVVLPPDVLDSILELIGRIKHRKTVYDAWGFDRTMTTSRGLTALFQGGPGTGKSMVAGIIANELGLDLYRIDLSRIMSKWIGETERNLAAVFDAAEDGQAIILFDEADSLFAKRTEVRSSVDRYANLEVNYLLQRLDSFEGIAILTTNFGGSIDSAFKRRLSLRLSFPFPDEDMREQLWRVHLPPEMPTAGRVRPRRPGAQVPAVGRLHPQRDPAGRVPRGRGAVAAHPGAPRARHQARVPRDRQAVRRRRARVEALPPARRRAHRIPMQFPEPPEVPAAQRGTGSTHVRYEDVSQDGRVMLLGLPQIYGVAVWQNLLTHHPVTRAMAQHGIVPILTRVVVQGLGGPISVRRPLEIQGCYELAHSASGAGAVDRIVLNMWAEAEAPKGRTHGPHPPGAGEPVKVGRVFAEHVFTRPFGPPGERKVLSLEPLGLPAVPATRWPWQPPESLLELPPGAEPLEPELEPDAATVAFGIGHTDSNQHVNSLVYPRLFEDAALRRLAAHGRPTSLLSRELEIAYRKPCFAGDRMRIALRTYLHEGRPGAVGVFLPVGEGKPHCYLRIGFAT